MDNTQNFKPRPRDFVQTKENLIFAVVSYNHEKGKVLSFLRYAPTDEGFKKVNTKEAQKILKNKFPEYLFYSKKIDASLHAVPIKDIKKIFHPQARLHEILNSDKDKNDKIEEKILKLVKIFNEKGVPFDKIGVSGSVLIKNQNQNSDIDLVIYGIKNFENARKIVEKLISEGKISDLDDMLWRDNYERRNPSLNYEEFLWHEKRKFNKGSIDGTKFDIVLVRDYEEIRSDERIYKKMGKIKLRAKVIDAKFAYDYPARYGIECENNNNISEVVSFTHTYAGQAKCGEIIEISGIVEEFDSGKRIVVGTTREAAGEYIKVVR